MRSLGCGSRARFRGARHGRAYLRLSDAGLGCPDWPLCYGQPLPAAVMGAPLLAQFGLGAANVASGPPLALAAAHNAGAAALIVVLVVLNFAAFRGLRLAS